MPIHKDAPYSELHSSKVVGTNDNIVSITDNIAVDSGIAMGDLDVGIFTRDAPTTTVSLFNSGDTVDLDGVLKVDTINEHTADTGVTVDGVLLKDGGADFSGTVKTDTLEAHGTGCITSNDCIALGTNTIGYSGATYGLSFDSTNKFSIKSNVVVQGLFDGENSSGSLVDVNGTSDADYIGYRITQTGNTKLVMLYNGAPYYKGRISAAQHDGSSTTQDYIIFNGSDKSISLPNGGIKTNSLQEYSASNGIDIGDGGTTDYLNIANDGSVTLYGDARYDCDIQIPVGAVSASGASAASQVARGLDTAWEYADNLVRQTSFTTPLRPNMDRSVAPTLRVFWESPTTSATCKWQLDYIYRKANEDMSTTSGTTVSVDGTSSATANGLTYTDFTLATPDSDDQELVMRLTRNGDVAGDTLGASAYMHGGKVMYKANKL